MSPAVPSSRWLAWSRFLTERYKVVTPRPGAAEMVLLHPLLALHTLRERWLVSSERFYTQVNLAIHPLLLSQERFFAQSPNQEKSLWRIAAASPAAAAQTAHLRAESGARAPLTATLIVAGSVNKAPSSAADHAWASVRSEVFLEPIYRRTERADELRQIHHETALIRESARLLADRMTRQTQRVEERSTSPAVLTTRRPVVQAADRSSSPVASAGAAEPDRAAPAWTQTAANMPGVNIDLLTDQVIRQIDRRIVASRERMGKI